MDVIHLTRGGRDDIYLRHPTAVVSTNATIGPGAKIWHYTHVREGANIGARTSIGQGCYIDVGVHIGEDVKIQNGVSVYQGVTVEDDVFIGPHAAFTNDLRPRVNGEWTVIPTHLRLGCSIGAHATVICGVTVGEYAMVGAGAVVTDDVPPFGLVVGNPARLVGYVCRRGHRMEASDHDTLPPSMGRRYNCDLCHDGLEVNHKYFSFPTADGYE